MTRETDRAYLKRPVGDTAGLPPTRSLAVLIVSQRGHESLEVCLDSVAEHLPELPVHVYDRSGSGQTELAAKYPAVRWFSGQANVGFAAACNTLVEHMPADTDLLLLDPHARLLGPLNRTREL
ncbi:glycosyl transferase, partial [Mycobacterium intracellulare]